MKICIRILFLETGRDRAQIGGRLADRYARFEPADCLQAVASALFRGGFGTIRIGRVLGNGDVHLDRGGLNWKLEPGRRDANNRVRSALNFERLANRVRIAIEQSHPKLVAKNDFETARSPAGLFVFPDKGATEDRLDAENIKKLATDLQSLHVLRALVVNEGGVAAMIDRHVGKGAVLVSQIEEVRIGK